MVSTPTSQPVHAHRTLAVWTAPSLAGLTFFCLTVLFGFEEPNVWLLLIATGLALAAPGVVLAHLAFTRELSREEKRMWLRELTGVSAASALADYLRAPDHRTALAQRLRERAQRQGQRR